MQFSHGLTRASSNHPLHLVKIQFTQQLVSPFYCFFLLILTLKSATILILEHACLLYASSSDLSSMAALKMTHTTYTTSNTHNELTTRFPASQEYSIPQVIEFVLQHRLE
jgi:hypothetical protein